MLNKQAIEALRNSDITGPALVDVFEKMAQGLIGLGAPGGMLNLNFIPPGVMPAEGELIPVITLAVRPFFNLTKRRLAPPEMYGHPPIAEPGPAGCPTGEPGERGSEGIPDGQQE